MALVFPACGNVGAPTPLSFSPAPSSSFPLPLLISPKCRVLCVLFPGTPAGSRGAASQTWESEMRWLFILPAALWGPHTFLFFLSPPPLFSLLLPLSSPFFLLLRVALERGLRQHQRPCTQITRLAAAAAAAAVSWTNGWRDGGGWREGWRERSLEAVRSR